MKAPSLGGGGRKRKANKKLPRWPGGGGGGVGDGDGEGDGDGDGGGPAPSLGREAGWSESAAPGLVIIFNCARDNVLIKSDGPRGSSQSVAPGTPFAVWGQLRPGGRRGWRSLGHTTGLWAHGVRGARGAPMPLRPAGAVGPSSRRGEAFIPGSGRPGAEWGAGEQLDYC